MELEDSLTLGGSCRSLSLFLYVLVGWMCPWRVVFGCFGFRLQVGRSSTLDMEATKVQKRQF